MSKFTLSEEESYMPKIRSNNVFYDSSSDDEVVYYPTCKTTEEIYKKDNKKDTTNWTDDSSSFSPIFPKTEFELNKEKSDEKKRNDIAANRKFKLCSDFESNEPEIEVENSVNDYNLINYLENSEKERLDNIEKEIAKEKLILEEKMKKEEKELNLLKIERKKSEERDRIIEELERNRQLQQDKEEKEFKIKQEKIRAKAEKVRINKEKREEEKSKKFKKDNSEKEKIFTNEKKEEEKKEEKLVSTENIQDNEKAKEIEAKSRYVKLQIEFKSLMKKYPNITKDLSSHELSRIKGHLNRRETILFNLFLSGKLDVSEKKSKVETLTDPNAEANRKTLIILSKLNIGCHLFRSIAGLYYPMKNSHYCEELDKVDVNQFCFHDLRFDPSLNDIVIEVKRKKFEWCSLVKSNYKEREKSLSDSDKHLLLFSDFEKLKSNVTKELMRSLKRRLILRIREEEVNKECQNIISTVYDILSGYDDEDYTSKYRSIKYIKDKFKLLTNIEAEFYDIKNIQNSSLMDVIRLEIEESIYNKAKDFSTMKKEEQKLIQRLNKLRIINSDKYKRMIEDKELVNVKIELYKIGLELKTKEIFTQTTLKNLKRLKEKKEKTQNKMKLKAKYREKIKKSEMAGKIRRTIKRIINLKIHNIKRENIKTHEMLSIIHNKNVFDKVNFDCNEEFIKEFLKIVNKTILLKSSYDTFKENSNLNGLREFNITTEDKVQQIESLYNESIIITLKSNYNTLE